MVRVGRDLGLRAESEWSMAIHARQVVRNRRHRLKRRVHVVAVITRDAARLRVGACLEGFDFLFMAGLADPVGLLERPERGIDESPQGAAALNVRLRTDMTGRAIDAAVRTQQKNAHVFRDATVVACKTGRRAAGAAYARTAGTQYRRCDRAHARDHSAPMSHSRDGSPSAREPRSQRDERHVSPPLDREAAARAKHDRAPRCVGNLPTCPLRCQYGDRQLDYAGHDTGAFPTGRPAVYNGNLTLPVWTSIEQLQCRMIARGEASMACDISRNSTGDVRWQGSRGERVC